MAATYEELEEDQASLIPNQIELGPIITALKLGTSMTKFSHKKKTHETKTFQLHLDDFKISWFRAGTGREEGKSKSFSGKHLLVQSSNKSH